MRRYRERPEQIELAAHAAARLLATLTTVLDTSALVLASCDGGPQCQARFTFAIARHAVVDVTQVFGVAPAATGSSDRLAPEELVRLSRGLEVLGCTPAVPDRLEHELGRLRGMYEPYLAALGGHLRVLLPCWVAASRRPDNWETGAWRRGRSGAASPADADD